MTASKHFGARSAHLIVACFLMSSCAQSAQPLTVHMQATNSQQEHDETLSQDGSVMDFYPDRATAHEVLLHSPNGGTLDATCMDSPCRQMLLKLNGSKTIHDGAYQFFQTDDPRIVMVRDVEGVQILGYFVQNNGGGQFKLYHDLQEAQAFEHQGDAARTAGKVVAGALIVTAVAALLVGAAAADAEANRTTTTCSSTRNSTTCTTY